MSDTKLRVEYKNGVPTKVSFGRGYMGKSVSMAFVRDGDTAIVNHNNAGSTDFEKALLELPFIKTVKNPTNE